MSLTQNQISLRLQATPNMCEAEFQNLFVQSLGFGFNPLFPPVPMVKPDPFKLRNPDMVVPYEPMGYVDPRMLTANRPI